MKIKDVCAQTGLTRKTIEYYETKGFISPEKEENGYRFFSNEDVEILSQISLWRGLGLSISEIREVLHADDPHQALMKVQEAKQLQLSISQRKAELLKQLVEGHDRKQIHKELEAMEKHLLIKERLLHRFPGYLGKFLALHFGSFLENPIESAQQEEAFNEIIQFLDGLEPIELPEEAQQLLDEIPFTVTNEERDKWKEEKMKWLDQPEAMIEEYSRIKRTEWFAQSRQLADSLKPIMHSRGYYDVFIPVMCRLSPDYAQYLDQLSKTMKTCTDPMSDL
ncbi:MerR family transcriptional regulator [Bacillus xiapuensis]|uniref:MerR family transcriptional regulator n=1 Tax=Bacillus xiapuensis TaxID=2014075 RepID=UPI0012FD613A|nr:MerR family transcriptional regulator [Bacillus xiapuensis]